MEWKVAPFVIQVALKVVLLDTMLGFLKETHSPKPSGFKTRFFNPEPFGYLVSTPA